MVRLMFELAQEQNNLELMEEQLGYVASVMAEQPELRSFLENPIVTEDAKIKLVGRIFESSIDKVALHFIYVMIKTWTSSLYSGSYCSVYSKIT